MATHVPSLTRAVVDAACDTARTIDYPVTLLVDDTHQRAVAFPSGRITVREDDR